MATNKNIVNPTDQGLRVQAVALRNAVTPDPVIYGMDAAALAELNLAFNNYGTALTAHLAAQDAALSATQLKEEARRELAALIRRLYKLMRSTPGVTPAMLTAAALPVPDDTRTPIPAPTVVPALLLEKTGRLSHAFRVIDSANPTRRGKAAGVAGFNVYYKVGGTTPPTGTADCVFAGTFSKTKFQIDFPAGDGNKTVWYIVVAVNAKGQAGPMSETLEATIAA